MKRFSPEREIRIIKMLQKRYGYKENRGRVEATRCIYDFLEDRTLSEAIAELKNLEGTIPHDAKISIEPNCDGYDCGEPDVGFKWMRDESLYAYASRLRVRRERFNHQLRIAANEKERERAILLRKRDEINAQLGRFSK